MFLCVCLLLLVGVFLLSTFTREGRGVFGKEKRDGLPIGLRTAKLVVGVALKKTETVWKQVEVEVRRPMGYKETQ